MTDTERKAHYILLEISNELHDYGNFTKQCRNIALILVNDKIDFIKSLNGNDTYKDELIQEQEEIKQEIEKL